MSQLIDKLKTEHQLSDHELLDYFRIPQPEEALFAAADAERRTWYGDAVYLRGLIEFTNYSRLLSAGI